MWFEYFFHIIFFLFLHIVNLVIFHPQYIDSGYLVITTPHTFLYLALCCLSEYFGFLHSLKMCMWFH